MSNPKDCNDMREAIRPLMPEGVKDAGCGACLTSSSRGSAPKRFSGPNFKPSILKLEIKAGDVSRFQ
jgi:hypothetical protein